jgi:hypothetical protein
MFAMLARVRCVPMCGVGVVCGLFMIAALVMLRCLDVMASRMGVVF